MFKKKKRKKKKLSLCFSICNLGVIEYQLSVVWKVRVTVYEERDSCGMWLR